MKTFKSISELERIFAAEVVYLPSDGWKRGCGAVVALTLDPKEGRKGFSPGEVQPPRLVSYWPIDDEEPLLRLVE